MTQKLRKIILIFVSDSRLVYTVTRGTDLVLQKTPLVPSSFTVLALLPEEDV